MVLAIGTIFIIRTPKKNSATARTTTTDLTNKMVDVDRERWYITVPLTGWLLACSHLYIPQYRTLDNLLVILSRIYS
jgi:hypothetical protein